MLSIHETMIKYPIGNKITIYQDNMPPLKLQIEGHSVVDCRVYTHFTNGSRISADRIESLTRSVTDRIKDNLETSKEVNQ